MTEPFDGYGVFGTDEFMLFLEYGTTEDLDAMNERCHSGGMSIVESMALMVAELRKRKEENDNGN